MNLQRKILLAVFLSVCCGNSLDSFGQSSLNDLEAKERINAKLREEDAQRKKAAEMSLQRSDEKRSARDANATALYFNSEQELPAAEKKVLTAEAAELQKYEEFLRQPNTGLFKLLNYQEAKAGLADAKSKFAYPHLRGGGAFYSFAKRNHNADEWAQLRLLNGILQGAYTEMKRTTVVNSGGAPQSFVYASGYSLSVLAAIGDVALEEVSLQTPVLQMLAQLQPPIQYQDFVQQVKLYEAGISSGQQRVQSLLPAQVNTTYVMRTLNFKRADMMVAFRIVHQDNNGNLHILWKQIQSLPLAELKGKK